MFIIVIINFGLDRKLVEIFMVEHVKVNLILLRHNQSGR